MHLRQCFFTIEDTDKIALIGINGTGKSTLLKILANQEDYQGKINKRKVSHNQLPSSKS